MRKRAEKWMLGHEWLVVLLVIVVVLRIPTLFEPYWYGDEGIYLTIGQSLARGSELYSDIHDNKPPLLYFLAALSGGDQFWFRMIAMVWNLVTVGVFYGLARKVFEEKPGAVKPAVGVFALLTNLPLLEGNIANAELFFLLPTILAARILWGREVSAGKAMLAGLIIGMGGLFKIPAVLEAGVWPMVWWMRGEKGWLGKSLALGMGAVLPLAVSGGWYALAGVGREYLIAAGVQNVPYLSSWKTGAGTGIFTLKGRAMALGVILAGIWAMRKKTGRTGMIVGIWGGLTLFAALLSGRPYPHYLMQMAGVLAVAAGLAITGKEKERWIGAGVLGLTVWAWVVFKFYSYPIIDYYRNFAKWAGGVQSQESYYAWFNPQVNVNYKIASVIMAGSKPEEKIFIWGDEPMIYALSRRQPAGKYTVKYHIKDFGAQKQTVDGLVREPPKYVVSFGNEEELAGLEQLLEWRYSLVTTAGNGKVYRLAGLYNN